MNGILARIGVEQAVLLVLAMAAVLGVLAGLGVAFWTAWFGRPLVLPGWWQSGSHVAW